MIQVVGLGQTKKKFFLCRIYVFTAVLVKSINDLHNLQTYDFPVYHITSIQSRCKNTDFIGIIRIFCRFFLEVLKNIRNFGAEYLMDAKWKN